MDRMTLREAAEKTSRSITTLRRYIRSGRLHAEKVRTLEHSSGRPIR